MSYRKFGDNIKVQEKDYERHDEMKRLIAIYKAKHGLPTLFDAVAEMVEKAAQSDEN